MGRVPLGEGSTILWFPSRQPRSYFQLHLADELLTATDSGIRGKWSWGARNMEQLSLLFTMLKQGSLAIVRRVVTIRGP